MILNKCSFFKEVELKKDKAYSYPKLNYHPYGVTSYKHFFCAYSCPHLSGGVSETNKCDKYSCSLTYDRKELRVQRCAGCRADYPDVKPTAKPKELDFFDYGSDYCSKACSSLTVFTSAEDCGSGYCSKFFKVLQGVKTQSFSGMKSKKILRCKSCKEFHKC